MFEKSEISQVGGGAHLKLQIENLETEGTLVQ